MAEPTPNEAADAQPDRHGEMVTAVLAHDAGPTETPPAWPLPAQDGPVVPERAGRFEQLLAAEHEQFDPAGEMLRSVVEYQHAPGLAASASSGTLRARSCPTCHSIGPRQVVDRTHDGRPVWCGHTWHGRDSTFEPDPQRSSGGDDRG